MVLVLIGYLSFYFDIENFTDRAMVVLTTMLVIATITSSIQTVSYYHDLQGRHSNQCHRAMALVVFCLASKPCFKNLPQNYTTLKYIAKKPRGLEVALVDFRPNWRH